MKVPRSVFFVSANQAVTSARDVMCQTIVLTSYNNIVRAQINSCHSITIPMMQQSSSILIQLHNTHTCMELYGCFNQ